MRKFGQSRRATVLLMVVSVLALLFVVIITFITITRSDRATIRDLQKSNMIDTVVEYHRNRALELMLQDIRGTDSQLFSNRGARFETIPGYNRSSYVAAFPAWSEGINNVVNSLVQMPPQIAAAWGEFGRLVLPAVTRLNPSPTDKPTDITRTTGRLLPGMPLPWTPEKSMPGWPTPAWRFIPENELDRDSGGPTFEYDDLTRFARNPLFDADGNGIPDAWVDFQADGLEFANSLAGTPVRIRGAGITVTENPWPNPSGPGQGNGADPAGRAWVHFLNSARYATSMTIYSHGGMVTIDSPSIGDGQNRFYRPFNRNYQARLLNSFRNPNDPSIFSWTSAELNTMFDGVARDRESIESLLRRRAGLPTANVEYVNDSVQFGRASVPPALAQLQGELNVRRSLAFTTLPQFPSMANGRISPVNPGLRIANASYKLDPFQMFNVSLADELRAAVNSMSLPPVWTMPPQSNNLNNPFTLINQRSILTTTNNSDDLARKQDVGDPPPIQPVGARFRTAVQPSLSSPIPLGPGLFESLAVFPVVPPPTPPGATFAGETKFPLTELAKAVQLVSVTNPALETATATPTGATSATGNDQFRYVPHYGTAANSVKVGDELIERMARLTYDMLASHSKTTSAGSDDWTPLAGGDDDDDFDGAPDGTPSGDEALSRAQQSIGYAVNIMAFAMPRDTNPQTRGYIDVVTYKDGSTGIEYIGYGPQPFITEAVAYYDEMEGDNLAIAVELFNPNDPGYDGSSPPVDAFALWLPQFAIEIYNRTSDQTLAVAPLGDVNLTHFNGRTFGTVIFKKESGDPNGHFDGIPNQLRPIVRFPGAGGADINSNDDIVIRLKKRGWDPDSTSQLIVRWYTVDQIGLRIPDDNEAFDEDPDAAGGNPTHDWVTVWRETTPYRLFTGQAVPPPGEPHFARWSVVMPPTPSQRGQITDPDAAPVVSTLGFASHFVQAGGVLTVYDPDTMAPENARPAIPLPLMNAGPFPYGAGAGSLIQQLNSLPIFGDARVTAGPDLALGDLRPRSFPTTGFLLYVPRYCHIIGARTYTMSDVLVKAWERRGGMNAQPGGYPVDFGHVPVFDNRQAVVANTYLSEGSTQNNRIPWGQLVFDYFTTIDPTATGVDPLKIPGRVNINVAPWFVLQNLPIIGPDFGNASPNFSSWQDWSMPMRRNWWSSANPADLQNVEPFDPSPAFWDPRVGVLVGEGAATEPLVGGQYQRNLLTDLSRDDSINNSVPVRLPTWIPSARQWQLGPWLAQAMTAYRDGFQILPYDAATPAVVYADAHLRNGIGEIRNLNQATLLVTSPYRPTIYGPQTSAGAVRGFVNQPAADNVVDAPTEFGFLSIGELANVKGFDSSKPLQLPPRQLAGNAAETVLGRGDFMRAVSLLALIDSQYLTTRSNTFTAYVSVMDRAEPEASTRAQYTIDRTNMLPRLEYEFAFNPGQPGVLTPPMRVRKLNLVPDANNLTESPVRYVPGPEARPAIIAEHRVGYHNTRFDD